MKCRKCNKEFNRYEEVIHTEQEGNFIKSAYSVKSCPHCYEAIDNKKYKLTESEIKEMQESILDSYYDCEEDEMTEDELFEMHWLMYNLFD